MATERQAKKDICFVVMGWDRHSEVQKSAVVEVTFFFISWIMAAAASVGQF